MPIYKTDAIVLKKFDFRETSIIADFYTAEHGRVSGVLKGIRTDPRKFASTLEPFSRNEIVFYGGRSDNTLHLVSQCDLRDNFGKLRLDPFRVAAASVMMELIQAITPPEDPNREIFDLALNTLDLLSDSPAPDKIATIFKIKILMISGFKPHLDSCVSCSQKISGVSRFSLSMGGLLCPKCLHRDNTSRPIFQGTVATLLHIERNNVPGNLKLGMNPQIKKELEHMLDSFLGFHLGRKLKSNRVMESLKDPRVSQTGGAV